MSEWVLGIDTSTEVSVGLARDGVAVGDWHVESTREHAERLQVLIDQACAEQGIALSDIARVAVGLGPGPYTGLRVGIVVARTLAALTGDFPREVRSPFGACSLDIVARQWVTSPTPPATDFLVATDARRHEVYWAHYLPTGERVGAAQVGAPASLPHLPVAGPGVLRYPDLLHAGAGAPTELQASALASGIDVLADAGVEPLYLRNPDAQVSTTHKSTLVQPHLRRHQEP